MSNPYANLTSYELQHLPFHLFAANLCENVEALLLDLPFLEAKSEAGLIFGLAADFRAALDTLPWERQLVATLRLLAEALRRDIHFIARHPAALFQCLWNSCWWYDCPQAQQHYAEPMGGRQAPIAPWQRVEEKLHTLLELWRTAKEKRTPGFVWARSLRPPRLRLGTGPWATLVVRPESVRAVSFSPRGASLIASMSRNHDNSGRREWWWGYRLWDRESVAELCTLHADRRIWLNPVSDFILLNCADRAGEIRDPRTGMPTMYLDGPVQTIREAAYSPNGRRLLTAAADGWLRVWETDSGKMLRQWLCEQDAVSEVCFSSDGRFATGGKDGTVAVYDAAGWHELRRWQGHRREVRNLAWSPDGTCLISEGQDQVVRVWAANNGTMLQEFTGRSSFTNEGEPRSFWVVSQEMSTPSWKIVALTSGWIAADGCKLLLWGIGQEPRTVPFVGGLGRVLCAALSPDGRFLAVGGQEKLIQLWDVETGVEAKQLRGHQSWVTSVAFSPDGKWLVSAESNDWIYLWDWQTSQRTKPLTGHEKSVMQVAITPDGEVVGSASDDHTSLLWDARTGIIRCQLGPDMSVGVDRIAFSPCGTRVVTGTCEPVNISLFEVESGKQLASIETGIARDEHLVNMGVGIRLKSVHFLDDGSGARAVIEEDGSLDYFWETGPILPPLPTKGNPATVTWNDSLEAHSQNEDVAITSTRGTEPLAWLPFFRAEVRGRTVAACEGAYVALFRIEGEVNASA